MSFQHRSKSDPNLSSKHESDAVPIDDDFGVACMQSVCELKTESTKQCMSMQQR